MARYSAGQTGHYEIAYANQCGSSLAFGNCKFAGEREPICLAATTNRDAFFACPYHVNKGGQVAVFGAAEAQERS